VIALSGFCAHWIPSQSHSVRAENASAAEQAKRMCGFQDQYLVRVLQVRGRLSVTRQQHREKYHNQDASLHQLLQFSAFNPRNLAPLPNSSSIRSN